MTRNTNLACNVPMTIVRAAVLTVGTFGCAAAWSQGNMTWTYGYDPQGNPTIVVDPNGNQTTMSYDALQRRVQTLQPVPVSGAGAPRIGTNYNGQGRVTAVQDPRNLTTTYRIDGLGNVLSQSSPDSGLTSATYDSAGNLKTRTDARGKTTTYTYDALNRVISIAYASGTPTTFEYDGGSTPYAGSVGKLTRMTDESGTTTFIYDALGRLTSRNVSADGLSLVLQYAWGSSGSSTGHVVSMTYPSGAVIGYGYDAAGRVQSITASGTTVLTNVSYTPDNQVSGWIWGNGVGYTRAFDGYGRLSSFPIGNPSGTNAAAGMTRTLSYDNASRITAFTHSVVGADQAMTYDGLDRLTSHVGPQGSRGDGLDRLPRRSRDQWAYSYDATGNRTSMTLAGRVVYSNTVDPSSNRFSSVQLPSGGGAQIYDTAGGLVADGATAYTYSDRGRMISATASGVTTGYKYNGLEQRISKSGTAPRYYAYGDDGKNVGVYDAGLNVIHETVFLGDTPIAVLKQVGGRRGQTAHLSINNAYADQTDTVRVITRGSDEAIVWRWDAAEAFGNSLPDENPSRLGAFVFDQRMPGQIYDDETGNFQNVNRDYRASTGSYIQVDPRGLWGDINSYAYVDGNPVSLSDPTGEFGLLGFVGGVTINTIGQVTLSMLYADASLSQALKCVDLRKVLASGLFGALGPTMLGNVARPLAARVVPSLGGAAFHPVAAPVYTAMGMSMNANMYNNPANSPWQIGEPEECKCVRESAAKNMPHPMQWLSNIF
jgi:RHS repeat-associated protein